MKPHHAMDCLAAREALSARLDDELADERPLLGHLRACEPCRLHERGLTELARGWKTLRDATPPAELWERIERRARLRPARPTRWLRRAALANAAAALVGFLGLGAAVRWLESERSGAAREHRWLEPLVPRTLESAVAADMAARPELHLLRTLSPEVNPEEPR